MTEQADIIGSETQESSKALATVAAKELMFTPEIIIEAVQLTKGLISLAAKNLKCTRQTVYDYAERYPEVKAAINEAREMVIDEAEDRLFKVMNDPTNPMHVTALFFFLKTRGKKRGYVERQEVSGDRDNPIQYNITVQSETSKALIQRLIEGKGENGDSDSKGEGAKAA